MKEFFNNIQATAELAVFLSRECLMTAHQASHIAYRLQRQALKMTKIWIDFGNGKSTQEATRVVHERIVKKIAHILAEFGGSVIEIECSCDPRGCPVKLTGITNGVHRIKVYEASHEDHER